MSPESKPYLRNYPEKENIEKAIAAKLIKQIKVTLLDNHSVPEKFFTEQHAGVTISKGEYRYSINWLTSWPHMSESIGINKRPSDFDAPYENEHISLNTWQYPRLDYEEYRNDERTRKRALEAQPSIETFINDFLKPESERTEAENFAKQIKNALLADEQFRTTVLKQKTKSNPSLQKLKDTFSNNKDVNNFLVQTFFCDTNGRSVTLPKEDYAYFIRWQASADGEGELITIEKNQKRGVQQTAEDQTISIDTTAFPVSGMAMDFNLLNGHDSIFAPHLQAKPHIQSFLSEFQR